MSKPTCIVTNQFVGGYCAEPCDSSFACRDPNGVCGQSAVGMFCALACSSDLDCRFKDGYVCCTQWAAISDGKACWPAAACLQH
jgi:hypothetical protein